MIQHWNDAWKKQTVRLVRCQWNKRFLKGQADGDRDMIRRAIMRPIVRTKKEYDELLMTVSEWGYCVETPADFNFAK